MMSKDVCQVCWVKHKRKGGRWDLVWGVTSFCPARITPRKETGFFKTNGSPPPWCPYGFEHAVSVGMTNAE